MKKITCGLSAVTLSCSLLCAPLLASAQQLVELNFRDARIDAVAVAVGAMLGKNVVVDPKVKGNLTLTSDQSVTPAQALAQLQAALRLHGYALLDTGSVLKLVPEAEAKVHASKVNGALSGGDVQTKVFMLNHESAANVLNVVKPLVSPNNVVNITPGTNALVVTDYADNLQRIGRLIASLDRSNSAELEIIPLQHAIASEMVPLLQRLMDGGVQPVGGTVRDAAGNMPQTTLMADSRSNALIVRAANAAKLKQLQSLVERLDQPSIQSDASAGNIHVVYLRHADALALAETLRAAIKTIEQSAPANAQQAGAMLPTGGGSGATPLPSPLPAGGVTGLGQAADSSGGLANTRPIALGQSQMPSVGGLVQADPSTNSLVITAPAPLFRQLRAVIDKLDSRRAQVLVESMIVEVADDKLAEFGVQWQAALGKQGSTMGAIGTNYGSGGNILNIAAGLASGDSTQMASALAGLGNGMNFAVAPKILGQYYLGALANFLQKDGSTNVLSKPNLMTLDNQEARIIIGENVPFVTGSYATTGSSSTVNPFTTVERKDVGLMLRIKPTINENGTVKLTVSQEASSVVETTVRNQNGPTTQKRSIESTVLVDDGSIVMLGGLMQDAYAQGVSKVPLLGDIPVVGNLFKSENRSRKKTNLMVFLRPVVLRDNQAVESLAMGRYDEIRAMQNQVQPQPSPLLGNVGAGPMVPGAKVQPAVVEVVPQAPVAHVQPQL